MKVSFPLSLKVAVWLLLNLLLLGVVAGVFLVAQGGLSWDSLVAGSSGNRIHSLAEVIAGEAAAAPAGERAAVLERFGAAYKAEFRLVRNRGAQIAGALGPVPEPVRQRLDEGPPGPRGGPGGGRESPGRVQREDADDAVTPVPPDGPRTRVPHGERARGRFLLHTADPAGWWIGLRVPFHEPGSRPAPATLLVHTSSFWNVVVLLNLETWLLVGTSVLVLSILFWLPLVHGITRDLRAVTVATEQIADGRFETRVAAKRRDEIGRLGESVNTMAGRLDTLVNGQKRFLADVAHELGSPLGRLQVATEIIENKAASPELRAQVEDIREEVQQLAALVNELLLFTRSDLRGRAPELGGVDLGAIVSRALAKEDKSGRVDASVTPATSVLADETLLTRAIANLVRNSLRYAPTGRITITSSRSGEWIIVAVEDEGPGVPAGALDRLGEPFYRPDEARTREEGGVGLGLAIVRSCVRACGGEVSFANRSPRGFRAELRLQPV